VHLQTENRVAVPILVILFENIGHPFETNTSLNEKVEAHGILAPLIVRLEDCCDTSSAQMIPKGVKRFFKLGIGDIATMIRVELIE
jgi:hypothetical protein